MQHFILFHVKKKQESERDVEKREKMKKREKKSEGKSRKRGDMLTARWSLQKQEYGRKDHSSSAVKGCYLQYPSKSGPSKLLSPCILDVTGHISLE